MPPEALPACPASPAPAAGLALGLGEEGAEEESKEVALAEGLVELPGDGGAGEGAAEREAER